MGQRTLRTIFIRSCLHEMNEQSISEVLDQVSEPILIVKKKHKVSMKPKYMNQAAKNVLHHNELTQRRKQQFLQNLENEQEKIMDGNSYSQLADAHMNSLNPTEAISDLFKLYEEDSLGSDNDSDSDEA